VCILVADSQKTKYDYINDIDEAIWKLLQAYRSMVFGNIEDEKIIPVNATDEIILTDKLHKQNRHSEWKIKDCKLVGTDFQWFGTDNTKTPGSLSFLKANITLIPVMDRPYCFSIGVDRGLFNFSASSGSKRMSWVNKMRSVIRLQLKVFREQIPQKTVETSKPKNKNKTSSGKVDPIEKPIEKVKEKKGKKDRELKGKSKKLVKNGVMYKEQDSGRFKKYNAVLKEGFLILSKEKDKKVLVSYDLLLCSVSSTIKEIKPKKESGLTFYTAEFISEMRKDILGTESKEDLEEWLLFIKNEQDDMGRGKKKKKNK